MRRTKDVEHVTLPSAEYLYHTDDIQLPASLCFNSGKTHSLTNPYCIYPTQLTMLSTCTKYSVEDPVTFNILLTSQLTNANILYSTYYS